MTGLTLKKQIHKIAAIKPLTLNEIQKYGALSFFAEFQAIHQLQMQYFTPIVFSLDLALYRTRTVQNYKVLTVPIIGRICKPLFSRH